MKKWQQRFMAIATALGFTEKVQKGNLTADEQKQIFAEYEKEHNISFFEDKEKNEDVEEEEKMLTQEEITQIASALGVDKEEAPKTQTEAVQTLTATVGEQKQTIEVLLKTPEVNQPTQTATVEKTVKFAGAHTATHLFGIENPMFARSEWYNEVMVTRQPLGSNITTAHKEKLMSAVKEFGTSIQKRSAELTANNQIGMLDFQKMLAGDSSIDYSDLTDVAGEYIVRRADLILAYFRTLPSVSHIFPVVSNVQNKEIAPTAHFGEKKCTLDI